VTTTDPIEAFIREPTGYFPPTVPPLTARLRGGGLGMTYWLEKAEMRDVE
jgi:hypothetical protein